MHFPLLWLFVNITTSVSCAFTSKASMQQLEALVFALLLFHAHALPWSMMTEVENEDYLETESTSPAQGSSPSWPTPVATPTANSSPPLGLFPTSTSIATSKSTASGNQTVTPSVLLDDTDAKINNTITITIRYPSSSPQPSDTSTPSGQLSISQPTAISSSSITSAAIICSEENNSLLSVNNVPASWCICGGLGPFSTISHATKSYCAYTTRPTQTISLTSHSTSVNSACRVTT